MLIADGSSPEEIIAMDREDRVRAIHQIASCRSHAIAYGRTASSIIQGHAFDERLRAEIRHVAEGPATTAACRALGMKRVTAISPYTEAVDDAEHRFFAEGGIEAIVGAHLGIVDGFRLAEPDAEAILDLAASAWDPQSDGLIAACLNFRSHLVIDTLQARIGKPAVTSTQAVLWRLFRLAGIQHADPRLRPPFASALARAAQRTGVAKTIRLLAQRPYTIIGRTVNHLIDFPLRRFRGIKRECLMHAPYCWRPSRSRARPTVPIIDAWLAKSETSPGKLGCQ
jgi:maleate isomerase